MKYQITDHQTDDLFFAENLTEITAQYSYWLQQQGPLDTYTREILNDLENGKIDNGLLRAVLGFEVHPINENDI